MYVYQQESEIYQERSLEHCFQCVTLSAMREAAMVSPNFVIKLKTWLLKTVSK